MNIPKPPFIHSQLLSKFICKHFPFKSVDTNSVKEFVCYDDRNYYFTGILNPGVDLADTNHLTPPTEFVVKFLNSTDSSDLAVVDGLTELKKYLYKRGFTCPYPIPSLLQCRSENVVVRHSALLNYLSNNRSVMDESQERQLQGIKTFVPSENDRHYCVSVLLFVEGQVFEDKRHSPQFLYEAGRYIGSMNRELMSFSHEALSSREMRNWNLCYLLTRDKRKSMVVKDPQKSKILDEILHLFQIHVIPIMNHSCIQKGIMHNDVNPGNIILKQQGTNDEDHLVISGIIDISDCVYGPYIFEVGIAMSHFMMNRKDPISYIKPFLCGYQEVFPLSQPALDILYYVILGRLAQAFINSMYSFNLEPTNDYIFKMSKSSWDLLDELTASGKEICDRIWKQ